MYCEGPTKTFVASGALAKYRRVRLDENGELAYCGAADTDCVGITTCATFARGEKVAVWLLSSQGTFPVTAAAATTARTLYAAASGKVDDSGTVLHGTALGETGLSGAADDVIEAVVSPAAIIGSTARTALTQEDLVSYPVPFKDLRVWDAPSTVAVAATAASDDLAVVYNTFLTASPSVESGDLKNSGATTRKVGFEFTVPAEYVAGETITLRVNAGMKTTVASVSATVDFQVARRAAPTVDVCATNAQSINSLVAANLDFTITPTNVVPGDVLEVVCSVAVNDSGTGTAVIGKINSIGLLLDIKG
jgi:hypothetical protein